MRRSSKVETEEQRNGRMQKKYKAEMLALYNAGGAVSLNQQTGDVMWYVSRDITIGGRYVGMVTRYANPVDGGRYVLTAGMIGVYELKVKSYIDAVSKLLKKIGAE